MLNSQLQLKVPTAMSSTAQELLALPIQLITAQVQLGQHRVDLEGLGDGSGSFRTNLVAAQAESGQHRVDLQSGGQRLRPLVADAVDVQDQSGQDPADRKPLGDLF